MVVPTAASNWKDKFTQQQLAKKRISDKINHRRTRQQFKQETVELERRLSLLASDDKGALINCLLDDNAALRARIHKYHSGFETILATGKDCLDADEAAGVDVDESCLQDPTKSDSADDGLSSQGPSSSKDEVTAILECLKKSQLKFTTSKSIYFQLSHILGVREASNPNIATNSLLESIMTWRTTQDCSKGGLELLLRHFGLSSEPLSLTVDQVCRKALSPNLFPDILEWLLYGRDALGSADSAEDTTLQLSDAERQRRAIAYCAYQTCLPWKKLFNSALERIVTFWADYKYFMFFAFPTAENYESMPTWRRPTVSQFQVEHPGKLDFLFWPRLRAHLLNRWSEYDLDDVYLRLFQSFRIQRPPLDIGTVVRLKPDMSDLCLTKSFEKYVFSIKNLTVDCQFAEYYPDLAHIVAQEIFPEPLPFSSTSSTGSKRASSEANGTQSEYRKRSCQVQDSDIFAQLCDTGQSLETENLHIGHAKALLSTSPTNDRSMVSGDNLTAEEGHLPSYMADMELQGWGDIFTVDMPTPRQHISSGNPASALSVLKDVFSPQVQSFDDIDYQSFLSAFGFNENENKPRE